MPISGVVVTCRPDSVEPAAVHIAAMEGVEVHTTMAEGKIVAVIEAETVDAEVDIVSRMHGIDGVKAVRMAYHNFEDVDSE